MDGFHLRQSYLLSHTVEIDGKSVPMASIKGAPITFDLDALARYRNGFGIFRDRRPEMYGDLLKLV